MCCNLYAANAVLDVQDGLIEDYYGQGRHAHKLIVDLQESQALKTFLAVSAM
jgi:hypothetical protein